MKLAATAFLITLILSISPVSAETSQNTAERKTKAEAVWQELAKGLDLGIFKAPLLSEIGDSNVRVLRIDPERYQFRLLNASAFEDGRPLSARQWSHQNGLVASINASMYQEDYRSSVSLMRTKSHINNPRLSKDNAILAFDRKDTAVPLVKIIDRQCEDFKVWQKNIELWPKVPA